ncbi:hypothetical protein [Thermococcus sp. JdF3]|uniref:hypothetical protein n=1 Tax=Thermococcus sp. JdF3 TaxID=1638258 RepID=UPI00143BB5AC|nr:hypothetical protein [Thermococcus sp. JdF3]NJE02026.1 hypothetical protein [Thermococcus sp. JdF3]
MKLVVLKERGSTLVFVFLVLFIVLFTVPLIYMLINVPEGGVFILGFFIFFLLMMSLGAYALLKKRREYRRAENFASLVGFSDSGATFPEELELETGKLEMKGYWVGSGKNRSYHVERKFIAEGKIRASGVLFPKAGFKAAVSPDGTGFVRAPAVRITDELYRNILLLFFTDEGEVRGSGTVAVATESDSAQINFRGEGKFIAGTVYSTLAKARRVKVALSTDGFEYEKIIGKGQSFEFRERMLLEEKVIMVGSYGTITPKMVAHSLGGGTVLLGHGEFIIRGILDIRLRPDVKAEETFRVELEEEAEEERKFEEGWGVFE